jgi:hypothetical protein
VLKIICLRKRKMKKPSMLRFNKRIAEQKWGAISPISLQNLKELTDDHQLSIASGDLLLLDGQWYVSHKGLLGVAQRNRCAGIRVRPMLMASEASANRWAFRATVYKSSTCRGFVGYGDADPSNVSPLMHGAEMRVAETRAVNRALRKAYGIGLCSVEELGANLRNDQDSAAPGKFPPQSAAGSGPNGRKVRDHLCQIIRHHQLDPNLVKAYAVDYCGVKSLKDATREQVENFVRELSDWAEKDRNALLCQLNSYLGSKEGAA